MKKAAVSSILVVVVLLAVGVTTEAQQPKKVARIGYLSTTDPATDSARVEGIRLALRELDTLRQKYFSEGETVRKTFYTAGRLFLAVSILASSAIASDHDAAGIAQAASAPLPEGHPTIDTHGSAAPAAPKFDFSKIVKPRGGQTVQEVYQEKDKLNGKRVTLRGKVVKYNEAIMGKNWLHLRDGTGKDPTDDLTVTTQAKAKVGDTVLVEGTVTLDKDLGAGYKYDVIIEDAKVKIEWTSKPDTITFGAIRFGNGEFQAVFSAKNNKSLSETLRHPRYIKLKDKISRKYSSFLDWQTLMGLVRLFLYDQPISMARFLAEMSAAAVLIALVSGYLAAKTLIAL
jgi:hypothetical protein